MVLTGHPAVEDGSTFTETITAGNHGPQAAPNVVTKVYLPGQLTVIAAPGGKKAGSVISWTTASLGAGKSVSYSVTLKVAGRVPGTALIAATIASAATDPKPLNDSALTAIKLLSGPGDSRSRPEPAG
jgi:hypothetical protein